MWISFTGEPPPLHIGDAVIERVDNFKLLGTWFQKDLKWNKHVEETTRKASKNLYCLRDCRRVNLPVEVGLTTYLVFNENQAFKGDLQSDLRMCTNEPTFYDTNSLTMF